MPILPEEEVKGRFESPLNLLNRLKSGLSSPKNSSHPTIVSIPPTASEVIPDLDEKISSGGLKSKAAAIMGSCLEELKDKIKEIDKPERLARIAAEMNKVVSSEDRHNNDNGNEPQIIIYSPSIVTEEHFNSVYVKE